IERIAYIEDDEPFYNAYIVDPEGRLQGSISLWELIKTRNRIKMLGEICHGNPIIATADMDQEEVAKLMAKYDLTSMPVLDANNKLLGRVTIDDVIDVIEEEATEDIFRLAGSNDMELYDTSPWLACKVRLPWLLITLGTGFITSSILRHFMTDFSHVIALSFFVPVVMAMGGNAGIQSSTLVIRSIALGTLEGRSLIRFFGREILAGAMMGLCCGIIVALWARYLINTDGLSTASHTPYYLAFTIGIALFSAMTFAVFFGASVPLLLERFHIDPAVASGPFVTSSNDISALLIYYGIAILLILNPLFGALP
ncbi:MAG: magnesium transporter, partial [Kiritimatiellae bacterium]|nr:magnesium transporter [Kiritimatiellia bacterium]